MDLLARAFVLARTIGARYETDDGLSVDLALSALRLVEELSKPSTRLQPKLMRAATPQDCIQRGFVPEATAVAAAAIRPEQGKQRVFVVADIGAGTSDFEIRNIVEHLDQQPSINRLMALARGA